MPAPRPWLERFWEKVDRRTEDECWPWTAHLNRHGYGQLWIKPRKVRATQVAWMVANNKPWPAGLDACHHCDNPSCVNPSHIYPGTPSENARDSFIRGRGHRPTLKSHCPKGHPYAGANLYIYVMKNGRISRQCNQCMREQTRRWRARQEQT